MRQLVLALAGCALLMSQLQRLSLRGALVVTKNPYHLAIDGEGFFQVTLPDGRRAYTRDGCLKDDCRPGMLTTVSGCSLGITIPRDIPTFDVTADGKVQGCRLDGDGTPETIGQLKLVRFFNSGGLKSCGGNYFIPTVDCGPSTEDVPGKNGLGVVAQGVLEQL